MVPLNSRQIARLNGDQAAAWAKSEPNGPSDVFLRTLKGRHDMNIILILIVGGILGMDQDDVRQHVQAARSAIEDALSARVLIIEDESIIALHIKQIVESLGHETIAIVRTRAEAVAKAQEDRPELILADISLADGSSGIDAVKDILAEQTVPVIFITAFPERLLTGERPEPAYLITKPFEPETVIATIGQALLMHRDVDMNSKAA
jgi:CheY-like chemotaxis protein